MLQFLTDKKNYLVIGIALLIVAFIAYKVYCYFTSGKKRSKRRRRDDDEDEGYDSEADDDDCDAGEPMSGATSSPGEKGLLDKIKNINQRGKGPMPPGP